MKNDSPAFQFYPKDFLSDDKVVPLSLKEVGAYCLLLFHCWVEKGLRPEIEYLRGLCRNDPEFQKIWSRKLKRCFYLRGGRLQNRRLDRERQKQRSFKDKMIRAGKKSARMRWGGSSQAKRKNSQVKNKNKEATTLDNSSSLSSSSSSSSSPIKKEEEEEIIKLLLSQKYFPKDKEKLAKFLRELAEEYPEIDFLEEVKKKKAWWLKKPLTRKSNPYLQLRNWMRLAKKFSEEQRRQGLVGKRDAGREGSEKELSEKWVADYERLKEEYLRSEGLAEEEVDAFKFPSLREFALKRERESERGVFKTLSQELKDVREHYGKKEEKN